MGEPRVAVMVRYGLNPAAWRVRHALGEVVDETPYGYHLAQAHVDLEWSVDLPENAFTRWWRMTVRRFLGFDFVHVWRNRHLIARADAAWTHTEREHLGVALLKALRPGRYRARSIAQSVWLWDLWPNISGLRRMFFAQLLRRHDLEIVLSRVNRDDALALVPDRRVVRVPFGTHFARPRAGSDGLAPQPPRVLVIGNDRHRDWDLLRRVSEKLPAIDFDILSLSGDARAQNWPRNVQVRSMSQHDIVDSAYAQATVVALPLRENRHASGCTVAIEGVSAGLPIVASDTGGIDEYLAGATSSLVPVGDTDAFAHALETAARSSARPNPDVAAERGLSEHDYVDRLVSITFSLLENRDVDPSVERFDVMETAR